MKRNFKVTKNIGLLFRSGESKTKDGKCLEVDVGHIATTMKNFHN